MRHAWVLATLAACQPVEVMRETDTGDPPTTVTGAGPTDSGTTGPGITFTTSASSGGVSIQATCSETDNVLRYACTISVDPPQAVDLAFQKMDGTGPVREFSGEATAAYHTVTLALMEPSAEYWWTAAPRTVPDLLVGGTWTTEELPPGARSYGVVDGTSSQEFVMLQSPCTQGAFALVVDTTTGLVNYYQDFQIGTLDPFLDGLQWTEDDTMLALVSQDIVEFDLWGNELLRLQAGLDFTERVHHDVFRKHGLTLVLFAEEAHPNTTTPYKLSEDMDGFKVFDGNTLLGEWRLADVHVPVPNGKRGRDYSHGNSIWMDDDYNVLLSFRHLSAVMSIAGDPGSPVFGEVNWTLSGNPEDTRLGTDFTLTSSTSATPTFRQQHNAYLLPDGRLAMFDNELGIDPSKVLQIELDPVSGTADIVAHYELPLHCDFQGGAWHALNGNPFGTCAPFRTAYEFDVGATDHRWSMEMVCASGIASYLPRFIPWAPPDSLFRQQP